MTRYLYEVSILAAPGPEDPGGRGEDFGKASPLGFLLLLLFFIAVAFLIRSMNKHLKRLPESFDPPAGEAVPPATADTATPTGETDRAALSPGTRPPPPAAGRAASGV